MLPLAFCYVCPRWKDSVPVHIFHAADTSEPFRSPRMVSWVAIDAGFLLYGHSGFRAKSGFIGNCSTWNIDGLEKIRDPTKRN